MDTIRKLSLAVLLFLGAVSCSHPIVSWEKVPSIQMYFPKVFGRSDGGKFTVTSAE